MAEKFNIAAYYSDLVRLFKGGNVAYSRVSQKIAAPGQHHAPIGTAKAFLRDANSMYSNMMASYGQYSRMARLSAYQEMESEPLIASALDLLAEEACAKDEHGKLLKLKSENPKIKRLLEELFEDVLNLEFEASNWIRNMPVSSDTPVPLLDGTTLPIKEVAKKVKANENVWVYAIQDKTNKIVPGKVVWCDKNYTTTKICKVTLDDGTYVETAPEHPFILRDGRQVRADQLKESDSLMPFYRKFSNKKTHNIDGYEMVYDPSSGRKYRYTHRVVAHEVYSTVWDNKNESYHIHHVDFSKTNNKPDNLQVLTVEQHLQLHTGICKKVLHSPEVNQLVAERLDFINDDKTFRRYKNKNHKVSKVELINKVDDVYCMTVIGPNGEHDRHNFAVCGRQEDGKVATNSGVFVANCKYGDNFLLLDHHPDYGVIGLHQLPVNEINIEHGYNKDNPLDFRYHWITQGNKHIEKVFMVHFKMPGNDAFYPYGCAYVEPARRRIPPAYFNGRCSNDLPHCSFA
jgi:hypothetical protein